MLLHDFLRRKSAILTKAKADIDNLLTEISDPKVKEAVYDWELGDPITDEYPQVDRKKDQAAANGKATEIEAKADSAPLAASNEPVKEPQADAGAQGHQPDQGQQQHEPAGGNTPA